MKNKRIIILCPFPHGKAGGQRFKYEQYLDHWKENGYEITISSFTDLRLWQVLYKEGFFLKKMYGGFKGYFTRLKDIFKLPFYDIVYVFMWVTPLGTTLFERIIRALSKTLIYDFDDSIYLQRKVTNSSIVDFFKGSNKSNYLIQKSDHVVVNSPFNKKYCMDLNFRSKCTFIPNCLDSEKFIPSNTPNRSSLVTIGWTGTFSSIPYLNLLRNVFIQLSKRKEFKLKIIGNFEYKLKGVDIEVIRWNQDTELEDLHSFDIGVYPVSKDEWALGKGGLKALQYMAIGIPTVATDYGAVSSFIEDRMEGLLVNNDNEWLTCLEELISNPDERERLGRNARSKLVNNFSVTALKSEHLKVLGDASNKNF
tara:strand:- start:3494 stop:4591 length:1098 start_codon:yes stop_codon:yes gene_type:complete